MSASTPLKVAGSLKHVSREQIVNHSYITDRNKIPNITSITAIPPIPRSTAGDLIYNSTSKSLFYFDNEQWREVIGTSSTGTAGLVIPAPPQRLHVADSNNLNVDWDGNSAPDTTKNKIFVHSPDGSLLNRYFVISVDQLGNPGVTIGSSNSTSLGGFYPGIFPLPTSSGTDLFLASGGKLTLSSTINDIEINASNGTFGGGNGHDVTIEAGDSSIGGAIGGAVNIRSGNGSVIGGGNINLTAGTGPTDGSIIMNTNGSASLTVGGSQDVVVNTGNFVVSSGDADIALGDVNVDAGVVNFANDEGGIRHTIPTIDLGTFDPSTNPALNADYSGNSYTASIIKLTTTSAAWNNGENVTVTIQNNPLVQTYWPAGAIFQVQFGMGTQVTGRLMNTTIGDFAANNTLEIQVENIGTTPVTAGTDCYIYVYIIPPVV